MAKNDAEASTIREYLSKLLLLVWEEDEGFDGKRPFGNSGWSWEMLSALADAGAIANEDDDNGRRLIGEAIEFLGQP